MNKLWHILSEKGGIILIETPVFSKYYLENVVPIPKWVDYLKTKGIDMVYDSGNGAFGGTLKLVKEIRSPKVLPFL